MFLKLLFGLVLVVVVLVAIAARRPSTFELRRSVHVAAPRAKVFPLVEAFASWVRWSPWEGLDPDLARTYGPIPRGKGATYAWEGKKSGAGSMEILETVEDERITIKIDFLKPFEAHNGVEFLFAEEAGGTRVTWTMSGPRPLMQRVVGLFIDFDALVGKDFEKGLESLRREAEA